MLGLIKYYKCDTGPAPGRAPLGGDRRRGTPGRLGEGRDGRALAIAALALAVTAGLLAAQPGGWTGAPSRDGGAAVPDAWPPSGDAAFAGLLPGYAFAQSVTQTLSLTAADSIDGTALELDGAQGITTFESGGSTYAAVTAYADDGVQILRLTGDAPPITLNSPPTVEAGPDQTVGEGDTVTLSGTATDDDPEDDLTYSWTHDGPSGITFANPAALSTTFAAPDVAANTTVTVTLTVNGGTVDVSDALQVTITNPPNSPPVVGAGADQEVVEGATVALSGTATDADPGDTLTYSWTHDSALPITITGSDSASASFTAPDVAEDTTITVTLTADDGTVGVSDALQVTIADSPSIPVVVPPPEGAFVTTWKANTSPDAVSIPVRVHSGGTVTIHWGDGSSSTVSSNGVQTHTYQDSGQYQVAMTGDLSRIITGGSGSTPDQLLSIDQWGNGTWGSMQNAFKGAVNMEYKATDTPDLSGVASMLDMFRGTSFTGNLSGWNVSNVDTMKGMFYDANHFDGNLSGWDVSAVTDMHSMFRGAHNFNQPLSSWDTSGVTDMRLMFHGARSFNGNISSWDTSGVETMREMFHGAISFNGTISGWDVSGVTNMRDMFNGAEDFNQDISGWDVSNVANMADMFNGATAFRQNLGDWYIVLNDTSINAADAPGIVGTISAQNPILDGQNSTYAIGTGGDSGSFNITGGSNLNMNVGSVIGLTISYGSPNADPAGQISVLNPQSYPLVGGEWTVRLATTGAGDLTVSAVDGTALAPHDPWRAVPRGHESPPGEGGHSLAYDLEFVRLLGAGGAAIAPSYSHDGSLTFEGFTGGGSFTVLVHTPGAHHLKFEFGGGVAQANNTASLTSISSTNDNGTYVAGDTVNITATFSEAVAVETSGIVDGQGGFDELEGAASVTTAVIDGRTYALVASQTDSGVQIIDITDPASPNATASVTDGQGGFDELEGAASVTTAVIDGRTYALVASQTDSGVQIIDITDPASPNATASVTDGQGGFDELEGAASVTTAVIDGRTYALVASHDDDGVQIIDITDPASPNATASVTDGQGGFDELEGAASVTTAVIDGRTYALVASYNDDRVQIIDITNPANPDATESTFRAHGGAYSVTTAVIDGRIYALVASYNDDRVQIIDITNPARPTATASVTDGQGGFDELEGAASVTTAVIDGRTYALVASQTDNGTQIIDITDPLRPTATASVTNGTGGFDELGGAYSVATAVIDGRTYALVASYNDDGVQIIDVSDPVSPEPIYSWPYIALAVMQDDRRAVYVAGSETATLTFEYAVQGVDSSSDLAYTGTGALVVPPLSRIKDQDSGAAITPELPVPGQPNSLSANKNIVIRATPTAHAGPDQTVNEGATVTLDGSGSSSPDNDPPTYSWSQTSGTPAVSLTGADTASPTFKAPTVTSDTALVFTLTVSGNTDSATDTVTITIRDIAMLVSISSTNDNGTYVAGDTVNITATFSAAVAIEASNMVDGEGGFYTLGGAVSVTTAVIDGRTYALVASFDDSGVQIIDITNPARPTATASATDWQDGFDELEGAYSVATAVIDGRTYALVASNDDDGVQIIDITDPASPNATASVTNGTGGFDELGGARYVTTAVIDGRTYALVASQTDDGVQIIDITDPARPTAAASVTDGQGGFYTLGGAVSVTTAVIDGRTYALVASFRDDGVQIIDITDPASPSATASVTNGTGGFYTLGGAVSVTTAVIDGSTYALVAAALSNGVQIIDITDPASPSATASVTNGTGGFDELGGAYSVTTAVIDGRTYALVASFRDSGVQIMDITDPARPTATASVTDGQGGFDELGGAYSVTTAVIDGRTYALVAGNSDHGIQIIAVSDPVSPEPIYSWPYIALAVMQDDRRAVYAAGSETATLTFEYVVQDGDFSPDLAYTGTDALVVPPLNRIKDQNRGTVITPELPVPGQPNSLSANKDIAIGATPTAHAGPDQTVNEGATVTLDGSGSSSLYDDPPTYSWSQTSGTPTVSLTGADTASPTFKAPTVTSDTALVFTLTVSDNTDSATDTVTITIRDIAMLVSISSTNDNGTYVAGDTINITATFSEAVAVETSGMVDGQGGFDELDGAVSVATAVIDGRTYALVASHDDDGVQIIDITDPASPSATASVTNGTGGFDELDDAFSITTAVIDGRAYALVANAAGRGVQIINITDPASPSATASVTSGQGGFGVLDGVYSVTTAVIDGRTYALVTSLASGVQIMDITDPASPNATAYVTSGQGGFGVLSGAFTATTAVIDGRTYALVTTTSSNGVQIIDITDPSMPTATASVTNGTGGFDKLGGARYVTTAVIDGRTYALVASQTDNGVQIIDITDPASPSATASVTNGQDGFDELGSAYSVATAVIDGRTYALVASGTDNGVQIIDITDPASPSATASVTDGQDGFDELGGASSVATAVIDGRTYALVASYNDDGVQMIDVTDPASPEPVYSGPYITLDVMQDDRRAVYVAGNETATLTFEYVVQGGDFSPDLAYTGTDAFVVPPLNKIKDQDSGVAIAPELPVPGQPNSLSANKDIVIGAILTANAGPNQTVDEGDAVTLDGSGSFDPNNDPLEYSWSQTSGPEVDLTGADTASPAFTAPTVSEQTNLVFQLTVTAAGESGTDTVAIAVRDSESNAPTADAGPDQTVDEGDAVTLDGSGSSDPNNDPLAYSWTHGGDPAITITGSDSLSASFTAPNVAANTTITVTLTVNDGTVDVSDALQVTITDSPNSPPEVEAGDDQEVAEGATVSLSGTVSDDDPEDDLTYSWTHDGDPAITITGSDSLSASFTAPNVAADTTITVTLTANDGTVDVSDALQVNITDSPNSPPVVGAGADQEVVEGATVTLTGTGGLMGESGCSTCTYVVRRPRSAPGQGDGHGGVRTQTALNEVDSSFYGSQT